MARWPRGSSNSDLFSAAASMSSLSSAPTWCSTCSQLPSRAGGTRMRSIGASHSRPAITLPWYEPKPTSTTPSSPWRSRTSWPMLNSPSSTMSVNRASPTCVLCAHTIAFALPSSIASRSRPLKLAANEGTTPEKNRWPQAASARRYVGPDLGSGGAPRRCAGSRCGQALAGEGAGTLAAAARPLGRRRLCGRSRLGAAPLSLAADNHTQAGEPSSLCGLAQALDCGANLCLVGALPASQQGLRNQSAQQRSLDLYCDDPSHEPVCAAGVPVKTSIVRRPLSLVPTLRVGTRCPDALRRGRSYMRQTFPAGRGASAVAFPTQSAGTRRGK